MKNLLFRYTLAVGIWILGISLLGCSSTQTPVEPATLLPTEPPAVANAVQEPTALSEAETAAAPETGDDALVRPDLYGGLDPSAQVVTFWHSFTGSQQETLQEIIAAFNASNQWGISVRAEYQGETGDLEKKMLTSMNTPNSPNLLVANDTQAATYQLGEALIDMDLLVHHPAWGLNEAETDDFFPGLFEQGIFPTFSGSRLSFPIYARMNVLYYNADWLAELGYSEPPGTAEAFLEAACGASGQPFSGSTASGSLGYPINLQPASFGDWASAFGARLFDHGINQYQYNNPVIEDAMAYLQGLVSQGCGDSISSPEEELVGFGRGTYLFAIDSADLIPMFREKVQAEANFNWRIAPLPHTTRNPVANVSGINASIPKSSSQAELAAWLFLKYFSSPEVQAAWVQGTHSLPVRESAASYLGAYFASSPSYQVTIDFLRYGTLEPNIPGHQLVQDLSQQALGEILEGAEVSATLEQLTTDANQILDEHMASIPESADPWAEVDPSGQTLTYWHQYDGSRQAVLDEIVNEFNATNKWGISVIPENQGDYGDIFLNMLSVLGTEAVPHLVTAYQHHAAAYQLVEGLVDMNSLVESAQWGLTSPEKEDFYPGILAQDVSPVSDGARLGFPVQRSTDVLYYNSEWLSELGYDRPPATPAEFKQMACAGLTPFHNSTAENSLGYSFYIDTTRFSSWVFAFGGDNFNEVSNQFDYNNEATLEMLTFMLDLIESGCAAPSLDRSESLTAFGEGALLFMVDSSYQIPIVGELVEENGGFDWAVAPLPSSGKQPVGNVFGASISIPVSTPEAELAAWLFLKYFTAPEIQARWGQESHFLPVRSSAADYMGDYLAENLNYQAALDLLPYGVTEPSVPGYDFIRQEVELALESILEGTDPAVTLSSLTAAANQVLTIHLER